MKTKTHPDELLAWYLNGTLEPAERAVVEAHLETCPRCRDEIALLGAIRSGIKSMGEGESPGELGLKRLLRDVRTQRGAQRTWWQPALAVAAMVIVVQSTMLTAFWPHTAPITPLGGSSVAGAVAQIQFQPAATEQQIRALLQESRATLVDGPGALGIYRIHLEDPGPALVQLRKRTDVVKHVAAE